MITYIDGGGARTDGYQPGVCNIGPEEITRRRRVGYLGVGAAAALAGVLVLVETAPATRLLVALPLALGFSGFLQARLRFCAHYGWRGVRNLGAIGSVEQVLDAPSRGSDRRRSLQIMGAASAAALAIAVVFAALPI